MLEEVTSENTSMCTIYGHAHID